MSTIAERQSPRPHVMRKTLRLFLASGAANNYTLFSAAKCLSSIVAFLTVASSALGQGNGGTIPPQALNISTRLRVNNGERAAIGGFIIVGGAPKKVIIRGIGPSLAVSGLTDLLADPTLELRDSGGALLMQNDNWQDNPAQAAELTTLGLAPTDPNESGIVASLQSGTYTAVLAGKNETTGLGLLEVYGADANASAQLANISTRGFAQTGDGAMIGGFILGEGSGDSAIIVRGIGPSLREFGLRDVLADPTLELFDSNGTLLIANDNWAEHPTQAAQLVGQRLAPQDSLESGLFITLPPGAFTAILGSRDGGVGLGLLEIYSGVPSATLIATSAADSGAGSLRDMVAAAVDGDTIHFDPALSGGAITLNTDEIVIDKNISISGPGPEELTVQRSDGIATPFFRVFHIKPNRTVTIEGLTISSGYTDSGGGIFADHATLTIKNCHIENNYAGDKGGGVANDGGNTGSLSIIGSSISSNGAYGLGPVIRGGGIHSQSGAVQIQNSHVDGNYVSTSGGSAFGGGIFVEAGTVQIKDSSVSDNFSFPSQPDPHNHGTSSGTGIYNDANGILAVHRSLISGNLTQNLTFGRYGGGVFNAGIAGIFDSTIRQNATRTEGGGIFNSNTGNLTVVRSTLSDNSAAYRVLGYGGAVANNGTVTILNTTLSGNHADGGGGAILNRGRMTINHSTLNENFAFPNGISSGGNIRNNGALQIKNTILNAGSADTSFGGSINVISNGFNLCSDDCGGFLNNVGDLTKADPILGPLQDNGGPTFTHKLLTGSPALDAGDPNFDGSPFSDQRGEGYDRIYNGRIDVGSYELQILTGGH